MSPLISGFRRLLRPEISAERWPKWTSDTAFQTPRLHFETQISDYTKKTTAEAIQLLKPRTFLELYDSYIAKSKNILEIGFFQGGMPLYIADMSEAEKIVAIDLNPVPESIPGIISANKLNRRIKMFGGVDQSNADHLRMIIKDEFNGKPIDLIADDASHLYAPTKKSFETCFSYLKPGGRYIIEDWGWSHWHNGDFARNHPQFRAESAPLSKLILEIVLAKCADDSIIESIEIANSSFIVITRGPKLRHGEHLDLDALVGSDYLNMAYPGSPYADASAV